MSTGTLSELPGNIEAAQIADERKADAKKHFDQLKKAATLEATSSMRIGWHGFYLKTNGLFGILGFEHESDVWKAAGVGDSTWYAMLRLAEAFSGLEEEQFCSMKQANAKELARLPESKRRSREWIRMAGAEKIEDFRAKVETELDGHASEQDTRERGKVLKMKMPASRLEVIQPQLEEYAKSIGVDPEDKGKALEMLLVEKNGEASLIGAITNAVQHIKAAKKLKKSNLSADELVDKVFGILDEMTLEFKRALDAATNRVQNLESGK